jgi:nucleotide-binding universal stress UspA family protein
MTSRIQVREVLWPTDFSTFSEAAFGYSVALASWFGARLTLLHVLPVTDDSRERGRFLPPPLSPVALRPTLESWALTALERFVEQGESAGIGVQPLVCDGKPSRETARVARERGVGLLVMGSHGRGGLNRLMVGSVTEALLRTTPCPILIVGPHVRKASVDPLFRQILCPLSLSRGYHQVLDVALSLASERASRLDLLYVQGGGVPREELTEFLRRLVPDEARDWTTVSETVVSGRIGPEILDIAEADGADLIVMGSHKKGALLPSTLRFVVRRAKCPVLVVPELTQHTVRRGETHERRSFRQGAA